MGAISTLTNKEIRLFLAKCTYEVLAGEKEKTGQTALSQEVILCYDETKKMYNLFAITQCLVEEYRTLRRWQRRH